MNKEKIKIYILREETWFISYDVFMNKDDKHYVQYKKHWEEKLTVKHWKLEDLAWEYEYWDGILKVTLIEKEIDLTK